MRRKRSVPNNRLGVNITALSDIMLCLLIFFMLVSKRGVDTGADETLELPRTLMGLEIEDLGNTVALNVYPGGADQPDVTTLIGREMVSLRITEPAADGFREPLREYLAYRRQHNRNIRVIIYADEELPYRYLEPVLLACAAAELNDVTFATGKLDP